MIRTLLFWRVNAGLSWLAAIRATICDLTPAQVLNVRAAVRRREGTP